MTVVVTLCSADRSERVARQNLFLHAGTIPFRHGIITLGPQQFDVPQVESITHFPQLPVHLSAARNAAGRWAIEQAQPDEAIIFLDADCLPAPTLLSAYVQACQQFPGSVFSGPVTYLQQGVVPRPHNVASYDAPHPARPNPIVGELQQASGQDYEVFWSLNFAAERSTLKHCLNSWDGFDESFTGYGGEDTDFAYQLRAHDIPLWWVGSARVYHLWHPVSSPPVEHVEDIVKNANLFYQKWGQWPMRGWLKQFSEMGLITFSKNRWETTI